MQQYRALESAGALQVPMLTRTCTRQNSGRWCTYPREDEPKTPLKTLLNGTQELVFYESDEYDEYVESMLGPKRRCGVGPASRKEFAWRLKNIWFAHLEYSVFSFDTAGPHVCVFCVFPFHNPKALRSRIHVLERICMYTSMHTQRWKCTSMHMFFI